MPQAAEVVIRHSLFLRLLVVFGWVGVAAALAAGWISPAQAVTEPLWIVLLLPVVVAATLSGRALLACAKADEVGVHLGRRLFPWPSVIGIGITHHELGMPGTNVIELRTDSGEVIPIGPSVRVGASGTAAQLELIHRLKGFQREAE